MVEGVFCARSNKFYIFILYYKLTPLYLSLLENIPEPRSASDQDSIKVLKECLKGGTQQRRGTYAEYQARMENEDNPGEFSCVSLTNSK